MSRPSKRPQFGHPQGVRENDHFDGHRELYDHNVHRSYGQGISGTEASGADSIVLSGGYEDDTFDGREIIYTGKGGRNEATGKEVADQSMSTSANAALVTSQETGLPVRVIEGLDIRGGKARGGYAYRGLWRVVESWTEPGKENYLICRFKLVKFTEEESATAGVVDAASDEEQPMQPLQWEEEPQEDELRESTKKYLPDTVVWTTDWTTGALKEQLERGVFDVEPPFQRRAVWDNRKASLYIESLLLGCPVPPITLAEVPRNQKNNFQYIVIDGKQRLSTLKRFAVDHDLKLTGLQILQELNGKSYPEVADSPEFERFENLPIRTVVMRNWKRDEVLQFVFHRLNSQVTPLSTHELRRSLMAGHFTRYLDERSANSRQIRLILGINKPDYRLRDAELLLRSISFCAYLPRYKGNLKKFLDSTTRTLNTSWNPHLAQELDKIVDGIESAITTTYAVFGNDSFQRFDEGFATRRFNRAVYDVMVTTLRFPDVSERVLELREDAREAFVQLFKHDREFDRWTEATTKGREAVLGRIHRWGSTLQEVTGITDLTSRVEAGALQRITD
ncbi:YDG/SRA domain-containing protein [Streptomyces sp. 184]|uniref:YDG/SRA domain-containing protein n=1 Tax=Streptomyces sp. 184 TaxID=1827526 RepID=UPI003892223C